MPRSLKPIAAETLGLPCRVGPFPIRKGGLVGSDAEGLLVPIDRAARLVGAAKADHPGAPSPDHPPCVEVETAGTFAFGFAGWRPTPADLNRRVWAFDEATVSPAPFRTEIVVGRVVGIETAGDGRPRVRVEIGGASTRGLPPLPHGA